MSRSWWVGGIALSGTLVLASPAGALSVRSINTPHGSGSYDGQQGVPTDTKLWVRICGVGKLGLPSRLFTGTAQALVMGDRRVSVVEVASGRRLEGRVQRQLPTTFRIELDAPLAPHTRYRIELLESPPREGDVKVEASVASEFVTGAGPRAEGSWDGSSPALQQHDARRISALLGGRAPPVLVVTPLRGGWPWWQEADEPPDAYFSGADGTFGDTPKRCFDGLLKEESDLLRVDGLDEQGRVPEPFWIHVEDGRWEPWSSAKLSWKRWLFPGLALVATASLGLAVARRRK